MDFKTSIFKDYDVRGQYPEEINKDLFESIAKEISLFFKPKQIAIGRDNRQSSEELTIAMIEGFLDQGVDVVDLGLITTDMIYFAAGKFVYDLCLMVTGSHVEGENGFKICRRGAIAIGGESGLYEIKESLLRRRSFPQSFKKGKIQKRMILDDWIEHALTFIDLGKIKPFKIVVDTGNGMGGLVMTPIEKRLPGEFINLFFELDGRFPNHFPNPLIEKNLEEIRKKINQTKVDFGIAFDADGDRAFFIDEKGETVSGSILTAIIAKSILSKDKGGTILYNAVCGWIVPETIVKFGGKAVRVRVGHSIIKEEMRKREAVFAGEHSGHYYFKNNFYADSGLIAVLQTWELISREGRRLSQIVEEFNQYPSSGEINFLAKDRTKIILELEKEYKKKTKIDLLDGLTVWFQDYWFNIRPSNTEDLIRLNLEAKSQLALNPALKDVIKEIESRGGVRA